MQAITLDVIMAGIFGIEGKPAAGTPEAGLRRTIRYLVGASTKLGAQICRTAPHRPRGGDRPDEAGAGRCSTSRPTKSSPLAAGSADLGDRRDILSLLLQARTEEGEALTDKELRDELLILVLAGHETTANSLSWAWERLVRNPAAHEALRERCPLRRGRRGAGRGDDRRGDALAAGDPADRPPRHRPLAARRVRRRRRHPDLDEHPPSSTTARTSTPSPFEFRPERWLGRKPGTYEWIPFGGGIRRCLGAALAMAEQRVVLEAMARRLDLEADDPAPEHALHRNVTMIPARGGRVVLRSRQD